MAGVKIPKPVVAISGHNKSIDQHNDVVDKIQQVTDIVSIMPVDPIYRKAQAEGLSIFDVPGTKPKPETIEGLNKLVEVLA